tara:strand:+ start:131 stop:496 length:366 start_codon:yes stop_codon:yes gene_type:complete
VAKLTDVAKSGGTASTVVNFNDSGVLRGITFCAYAAAGVEMDMSAFAINIYRQNQEGLVTQSILVPCVATQPRTGMAFTLPPLMGDFRVQRLTQLVVTVENNDTSDDATRVDVGLLLNADD